MGRFCGAGVTVPARVRIRLIVARDTRAAWWWARCQPIVSAPASSPCSVNCLRSASTSSTVCGGVAVGLEAGATGQRLERRLPLDAVAGHELADPALGDAVGAGYLGLGLAGQDSGDDKATLRHPASCGSPPMPKTCDTQFRCPETPHSDVLSQDTTPSAFVLIRADPFRRVRSIGAICRRGLAASGCRSGLGPPGRLPFRDDFVAPAAKHRYSDPLPAARCAARGHVANAR